MNQNPSTAKLRIWTLRFWGFRGPGFRSARHVFCGDASRLFLAHFPKHLNSVLGRTELCHEVRHRGPQKPQIIRNANHHLALLEEFPQNLKNVISDSFLSLFDPRFREPLFSRADPCSVDFGRVDFFSSCFSKENGKTKIHRKIPPHLFG